MRGSEHTNDEKELVTAHVGGQAVAEFIEIPFKVFSFCTNPQ